VTLQKQHHFLDRLLRSPGAPDHLDALLRNARDLNETEARLFNDVQRLQSKVSDNSFGGDRANAFDETAAQVLLQTGQRRRFGFLGKGCLELTAIFGMLSPEAG